MTALGVVDEAEAALTEAERTEQYRAVALALGEEAPPGVSVEQARRALTEAQRQHRLARDAIATLEGIMTGRKQRTWCRDFDPAHDASRTGCECRWWLRWWMRGARR